MVHDNQVRYALSVEDGADEIGRAAVVVHAGGVRMVVNAPPADGSDEGRARDMLEDVVASVARALPELFGPGASAPHAAASELDA